MPAPVTATAPGPRARGGDRGEDRGQATVELALVLPVVALLMLAMVQVGLVVHYKILVVHAAREAARSAAVEPGDDPPMRAAVGASGLDLDRLEVEVGPRGAPGSQVRVTVTYEVPTDVPLIGALLGDVTLSAQATMRVEG